MLTVGLDIITPRLVLGKMNLQIAGNIKVNHSKSSSITYHRSKPYYHYLSIRIFTNLTWHVELLYHPVCALAYRSWFQLQMISQDHVRIQMSNISPYASTASNFSPMVNETNQSPTFVLFMYTLILLILKQPAKKRGETDVPYMKPVMYILSVHHLLHFSSTKWLCGACARRFSLLLANHRNASEQQLFCIRCRRFEFVSL